MAKMSDSEIQGMTKKIIGKTTATAERYEKKIAASKKRADKQLDDKVKKIAAYRKEASRKAALANKRIARLEANGLQNSPAYQGYIKSGGGKFAVKGKSYNEVQSEVARMNNLINAVTSTVRGTNKYLKSMAKDTGMKYKNLKELQAKTDEFFRLSSMIDQYLTTVEDIASAIGYQKIWQSINVYVKDNKIDLSNSKMSIEDMADTISKAIVEYEKPEPLDFSSTGGDRGWFKLPKE